MGQAGIIQNIQGYTRAAAIRGAGEVRATATKRNLIDRMEVGEDWRVRPHAKAQRKQNQKNLPRSRWFWHGSVGEGGHGAEDEFKDVAKGRPKAMKVH